MRWLSVLPILLLPACSEAPPGPEHVGLRLSLEDVSCTEAWLCIQASNTRGVLSLLRDGNIIRTISPGVSDTVVLDGSLTPGRSYTYQAYQMGGGIGKPFEVSEVLWVRTLDTTTHSVVWEAPVFLGDDGGSILYDVSILNDTLAYAAGEISVLDSSGQFRNPPCNVAKWNGRTWELSTTTDAGYGYGEIYSILVFGADDIWAGSTIPEHWNGQRWVFYGSTRGYQGGFWIRKIWGASSDDSYVVGDGGNIRHFDGATWQKLESGTTVHVRDIWGRSGPISGNNEILCVASNIIALPQGKAILSLSGNSVIRLPDTGLPEALSGIWFGDGHLRYVVGDGMYRTTSADASTGWRRIGENATPYYTQAIRGTDVNDVFVVGHFAEVLHFNGVTWHSYREEIGQLSGIYFSVAVSKNLVIVVGDGGAVVIGRRRG